MNGYVWLMIVAGSLSLIFRDEVMFAASWVGLVVCAVGQLIITEIRKFKQTL